MGEVAAVYGLVGALGGALLGALGTLAAPWLQNRHTDSERRRSQAEAKFHRLMELRKATREATMLLEEGLRSRSQGTFDCRSFNDAMLAADAAIVRAADDLAIDGLDFTIHSSSAEGRDTPEARELRGLLLNIRETARLFSVEERHRPVLAIRSRQAEVNRLRSALLVRLMDRMDALRDGDLARR